MIAALLLLLAACTDDPQGELRTSGSATTADRRQKIIHTSDNACKGSLLVYFDEGAIEQVEATVRQAASTRSAATRAGIGTVDAVLDRIGTYALRRVFPYNARTEERTRSAGLHRWYLVEFDDERDLDESAAALATVSEVASVQFNIRLEKSYDPTYGARPLTHSEASPAATSAAPYNDQLLPRQWHYHNVGDLSIAPTSRAGADINLYEAWKITAGNPNVIVAVVDEGVKYSHPDLAANMWSNPAESAGASGVDDDGNGYTDDLHGFNFVTRGPITWDVQGVNDKGEIIGDSGHGTHVAGTVAAVNNNGQGVCGVAGGTGNNDGVRIMSCQIFSGTNSNSGTAAVSAEAIKYAADNGASILQCSWGYMAKAITSDNQYEQNFSIEKQALDYFVETKNCKALDGGLVIFASGNESSAMAGYPGACAQYISVTAFGPDYLPAYYTNYGPGCNIAAPGGDYYISRDYTSSMVLSTMPSELNSGSSPDYGYMQGTSMACPHVSGIAALGLSRALDTDKSFTLDEFKAMLLTSVNDLYTGFNGTKDGATGLMRLSNYRNQMGTGAIDAYQFLMQIEGTPCLRAQVGTQQLLALSSFFGQGSESLTYTDVTMTQEAMDKLGVTGKPSIEDGKLKIQCSKPGVAHISITAIAGGSNLGGGDAIGGQAITKEFAIIARGVDTSNGGWL